MRVCLKKFNEKDQAGRYYTKAEMRIALDEYLTDNNFLYGVFGDQESTTALRLDQIAFIVNKPTIEDDGFYGDIQLLNTPEGVYMANIEELCAGELLDTIRFGLIGIGILEDDGLVRDYQLIGAQAVYRV